MSNDNTQTQRENLQWIFREIERQQIQVSPRDLAGIVAIALESWTRGANFAVEEFTRDLNAILPQT